MEVGRWKMEDGSWKLEVGRWKMEDGRWKLKKNLLTFKFVTIKMKNSYYIVFTFFICALFSNCNKKESTIAEIYNKKANELISQILKENNSYCMLEISKKSMIEINNNENPEYNIRNFLLKELNIENNKKLDNLVSESEKFDLDMEMVKKNNIKIVTRKDILDVLNGNNKNILQTCSTGIICFQKPIFDKTFEKAVIDISFAFCCTKEYPLPVYEYKTGKWNRIKK